MAKKNLRLRNDRHVLNTGMPEDINALLAGFENISQVRDPRGNTIKDVLLQRYDIDVLPILTRWGIPLNAGDFVPALSISGHLQGQTVRTVLQRLQAFKDQGVDLSQTMDGGNTLWHHFAHGFDSNIFQFLLDNNVPSNVTNDDGDTALHVLVRGMHDMRLGQASMVLGSFGAHLFGLAMQAGGVDLDSEVQRDKKKRDDQEVWVECLVMLGCDPWLVNNDGETVFDSVRRRAFGMHRGIPQDRQPHECPNFTEAQHRDTAYSNDNRRLIERLESLTGKTYVGVR